MKRGFTIFEESDFVLRINYVCEKILSSRKNGEFQGIPENVHLAADDEIL